MSLIHILTSFFLPLCWTIGTTTVFIYIFKKRFNFQQLLPFSLMAVTLLAFFITMLCHNISVAIWLLSLLSTSSVVFFILDKEHKKSLSENIMTPGFVVYVVLYIFLYLINLNKVIPLLSDSSMHWAPHVWTMWLRNDFYTSPGLSVVNHGDYPPALQLFELLWMKLSGFWNEGFMYLALEIISLSFLFPSIAKLNWHKKKSFVWLASAAFISTAITMPLILPVNHFYNNIEVDTAVAFAFAYGIYVSILPSKSANVYKLIKLIVLMTFLCLLKQIAILFAAIVFLIFIGNLFLQQNKDLSSLFQNLKNIFKDYKKKWQSILVILLFLLIPFVAIKLWAIQTDGFESPDKGIAVFHLGLDNLQKVPSIITGQTGNPSQQEFPKRLLNYLISYPLGFQLNFLGSTTHLQFFAIGLALIIFVIFKQRTKLLKNQVFLTTTILLVGWVLYLLIILATFLVGGMIDIERNNIWNVKRYLNTYIFGIIVLTIMIVVNNIITDYKKVVSWSICFLLFVGLIMNFSNTDLYNVSLPTIQTNNSELLSYKAPEVLRKLTFTSGASFTQPKSVIVTEKTRDPSFFYLQYLALPNRVMILTEEMLQDKDLCKQIKTHDYLIIDYVYTGTSNISSCLKQSPSTYTGGELYIKSQFI